MIVLDAGVPLVVGSFTPLPDTLAAGDWARVTGLAPVHGFLLPQVVRGGLVAVSSDI